MFNASTRAKFVEFSPHEHFAQYKVIDLGTQIVWTIPEFWSLSWLMYKDFFETYRAILMCVNDDEDIFIFIITSKSTYNRVHGCFGHLHEVKIINGLRWCADFTFMQLSQLRDLLSILLSRIGPQKYEHAIDFMITIPKCTECSSRSNAALNLSGIIIRCFEMRQSCSVVFRAWARSKILNTSPCLDRSDSYR